MIADDDPHNDAGAYVLHALPPDEARAFESHLANCAACWREVEELSGVAALLGAAEARTPPPQLRDRVLGLIIVVGQERGSLEPYGPAKQQETPVRRAEVRERWYRRRARRLGLALAAAVAAAVALGGATWWQYSEADSARQQADSARRQAAAADAEGEALTDLLAAPDATISTAELSQGATASVIASRTQEQAAFVAAGLPPLTDDRTYELWYAEAGTFRPAGLLAGVGGRLAHILERPLEGATAVGITVEPAGGSKQPTTDPLGVITVPA
ncbi:anti-sigma factor domain-containing protein [Streptomyces sp. NPDC058985]|uniref:anti-sigma factor n=1 Tax=Streptomyces sp. NPDC058985 TaxID=3346684 RepID=UPI003691AE81